MITRTKWLISPTSMNDRLNPKEFGQITNIQQQPQYAEKLYQRN